MGKAFTLTPTGLMINEKDVHLKGPMQVFDVVAQLGDSRTRLHTLKYEKGKKYHIILEEPHSEMEVICGRKFESKRTIWFDELPIKVINCKDCKKWLKKHRKKK